MFFDDGEPFNPFQIGTPTKSTSLDYEIPLTSTYPPPLFATWPPPKEHTNRSVSQRTFAKQASTSGLSRVKAAPSYMGEVAVSKAINEEMSFSKRQHSVRTLLPVRNRQSPSDVFQPSCASVESRRSKQCSTSGQRSAAAKDASRGKREDAGGRGGYSRCTSNIEDYQADKDSRCAVISVANVQADRSCTCSRRSQVKDGSRASIKENGVSASRTSRRTCRITPSLESVADSIRRELAQSAKTSKLLAAKASELSKRLKGGHESIYSLEKVPQRSHPSVLRTMCLP